VFFRCIHDLLYTQLSTGTENKMPEHKKKITNFVLLRFASSSISHKHTVISNEISPIFEKVIF